jgi:putative transposase
VPDAGELRDWAAELVDRARNEGVALTGEGGLLTGLVRQVLQTGLEVEMTDHLGHEPHAPRAVAPGTAVTAATPRPSRPRSVRLSCVSPGTATAALTNPQTVRKGQLSRS